jgi:hypothetical protein
LTGSLIYKHLQAATGELCHLRKCDVYIRYPKSISARQHPCVLRAASCAGVTHSRQSPWDIVGQLASTLALFIVTTWNVNS